MLLVLFHLAARIPLLCAGLAIVLPVSGLLAEDKAAEEAQTNADGWQSLFNGKNLDNWKITEFGGQGYVTVDDNDDIVIREGADLSGITSTRKDLPTTDYEVKFEAQRQSGTDFFSGFTFPVGDSACSLILGGWGGGVCGISSLDFMDASENETTSYENFVRGRWYKVRVRVTDKLIEAWLDGKRLVKVERELYRIDVRFEMELSKPMGFATYQTVGRIRNARLRKLPPTNAAQQDSKSDADGS